MQYIVITGSTSGIGYGLAKAFLSMGCQVMLNGRSAERVADAVDKLAQECGVRPVGHACDIRDLEQVQGLWDAAHQAFGKIDFWLNNAGTIHPQMPLIEQQRSDIESVISTNMYGLIFGSQVALKGMLAQGHGQIFNMEGYGSNGMMRPAMAIYGCTKRAARYFTKSLVIETKDTPVKVCRMSPGIVITDLLRWSYEQGKPEHLRWARWMFNLVADRVEVVTPWLAHKILSNTKHDAFFNWLSFYRILYYGFSYPFRKRVF